MSKDPASITHAIVEALYAEALALAEDARGAFDDSGLRTLRSRDESTQAQVTLSCEALRTTTRMMHVLAWLLNHRAFLAGELTEFQLRRHGRLPPAQPISSPQQLAALGADLAQIIERTSAFYARVERLDASWMLQGHEIARPVLELRGRIGRSFAISGS